MPGFPSPPSGPISTVRSRRLGWNWIQALEMGFLSSVLWLDFSHTSFLSFQQTSQVVSQPSSELYRLRTLASWETCSRWGKKWRGPWILPLTTVCLCCSSLLTWAPWALLSMNIGHPQVRPSSQLMLPKSICGWQGTRRNPMKGGWKSSTMGNGAQSVMTISPSIRQTWSAGSWATWKLYLGSPVPSMEKEKASPRVFFIHKKTFVSLLVAWQKGFLSFILYLAPSWRLVCESWEGDR